MTKTSVPIGPVSRFNSRTGFQFYIDSKKPNYYECGSIKNLKDS